MKYRTILDAIAAINRGEHLPSETQQRAEKCGETIVQGVAQIMSAPNGTYAGSVDGRRLAKKAEGRWSYAKKMMREDEA